MTRQRIGFLLEMPVPSFDHNLVLPPHLGDPRDRRQLSPYPCTTVELCEKLGNTPERVQILSRFLDFRERLHGEGMTIGFQWLDGSFLENVEAQAKRAPNDLDVVTVYWGYDRPFLQKVVVNFPDFASPRLAKANYQLDHYNFDAGFDPEVTIEGSRYWILLFSHNRLGIWKGMVRIELNTPTDDAAARLQLAGPPPSP